jgi:hypothetical protein
MTDTDKTEKALASRPWKDTTINRLITEAIAIEEESAKKAGALGYMARAMVQTTLPHKAVKGQEFTRSNGHFKLTMFAPSHVGLPYGNVPRLLLAWLTTEAVLKKERTIQLGDNLSGFMRELGLVPTGGRWGTITRLREQTKRLFGSAISCTYEGEQQYASAGFMIADKLSLWWNPQHPEQSTLFGSYVQLSETFFKEVIERPVPVDMRALKALKRSPLALDIYCWLTYRLSYLNARADIPWPLLQLQFGSDYANNAEGQRNFKKKFLLQLRKVKVIYREAKIEDGDHALTLFPSKPHIPKELVGGRPGRRLYRA